MSDIFDEMWGDAGTDIVRTGPDAFFVLEDHARTPLICQNPACE